MIDQSLLLDVKEFRRALRIMGAHASPDETRLHLCNVCVQSDAKGVRMLATDGHRLAILYLTREAAVWRGAELLDKATCSALTNLAGGRGFPKIDIDFGARTATRNGVAVTWRKVDTSFPDYKTIMPKSATMPAPHALGPKFLRSICAAFEAMSGKASSVFARTESAAQTDVVVFSSPAAKDLVILLMPMRIDGSDGSLAEFLPDEEPAAVAAE